MSPALLRKLSRVNRELWVVLTMFVIAGVLNFIVASGNEILYFYMLPTLFSAYVYGRRHAVLTAFGSIFLAVLVLWFNPTLLANRDGSDWRARVVRCGSMWAEVSSSQAM